MQPQLENTLLHNIGAHVSYCFILELEVSMTFCFLFVNYLVSVFFSRLLSFRFCDCKIVRLVGQLKPSSFDRSTREGVPFLPEGDTL